MLVAPAGKDLPFTFGSSFGSGNFHDVFCTQPFQLANLFCALILVRESPPNEFEIFSARGISKDRNMRCDAAFDEVGRLERSGAARVKRYDNHISDPNRFVDDERPSCGSQHRLPNGGNGNDGSHDECKHD